MMSKEEHLDAVVRYVEKHWFTGQDLRQIRLDAQHRVSQRHEVTIQTVYTACKQATHSRSLDDFDDWLEKKLRETSKSATPAPSGDREDETTQLQRIEAKLDRLAEYQQKTNARLDRIEFLAESTDERFFVLVQGFVQMARNLEETEHKDK